MSVVEVPVVAPAEVTVGDVLERAADRVEEFGWQQGCKNGLDPHGPNCILNHVNFARTELRFDAPLASSAHDNQWPERLGFASWPEGWDWNDAAGRKSAEVVARLREAARNARQ